MSAPRRSLLGAAAGRAARPEPVPVPVRKKAARRVTRPLLVERPNVDDARAASLREHQLEGLITRAVHLGCVGEDSRMGKSPMHVGNLGDCPRAHILATMPGAPRSSPPTLTDRVCWSYGRGLEEFVRVMVIRTMGPEKVWGKWTCGCDEPESYLGAGGAEYACSWCKGLPERYEEADLLDDEADIVGHADFVLVTDGGLVPVEIKSITNSESANQGGTGFASLTAPKPEHAKQVSAYHRLLSSMGERVADKCIVIYGCKEYNFRIAPLKEFVVNPNVGWIQASLDAGWVNAMEVKGHREAGTVPPRVHRTCANPQTTTARNCPYVGLCFNLP